MSYSIIAPNEIFPVNRLTVLATERSIKNRCLFTFPIYLCKNTKKCFHLNYYSCLCGSDCPGRKQNKKNGLSPAAAQNCLLENPFPNRDRDKPAFQRAPACPGARWNMCTLVFSPQCSGDICQVTMEKGYFFI